MHYSPYSFQLQWLQNGINMLAGDLVKSNEVFGYSPTGRKVEEHSASDSHLSWTPPTLLSPLNCTTNTDGRVNSCRNAHMHKNLQKLCHIRILVIQKNAFTNLHAQKHNALKVHTHGRLGGTFSHYSSYKEPGSSPRFPNSLWDGESGCRHSLYEGHYTFL